MSNRAPTPNVAKTLIGVLLIFSWAPLFPMFFGNPAQPALQPHGVIIPNSWVSVRVGYVGDYLYRQRYQDEFKLDSLISAPTFIKLSTDAAEVTVNFKDRIDLYTLLGQSTLQVDQDIFTGWNFSWGVGAKLVLFQEGNFRIGVDAKYFQTNQVPRFLVGENLPYPVVTDFVLQYEEAQCSFGLSHQLSWLCPYISATYIVSKIDPNPLVILVRLPDSDTIVDITSKSVITDRRWGIAIGATLIGGTQTSLTIESRMLNQNGFDINGELRF